MVNPNLNIISYPTYTEKKLSEMPKGIGEIGHIGHKNIDQIKTQSSSKVEVAGPMELVFTGLACFMQ